MPLTRDEQLESRLQRDVRPPARGSDAAWAHRRSTLVDHRSSPTPFSADASAAVIDESASALARDLVDQDEVIILLLRPSLWFVLLASAGSLIAIALITLLLAYMAQLPWTGWNDTQAFALGAGLCAIRLAWQMLEWLSRVYVLTDRRIIARSGVLRIAIFQTPLKNIQHTAVFVSLRERSTGLGTIAFATSGSDTFDCLWLMLRQPNHTHKIIVEAIRRYGR